MKNSPSYFFCVDGGGTKSIANLYDSNEKIISTSKIDSGNIFNDVYGVEKNIYTLWNSCCKKANLNKNKIHKNTIASLGLAGGRSKKHRNLLKSRINFFKEIIICTDGYIALAGTSATETVAILNIGTGVVAHLILKNNLSQQISGWGYPHGDKGGGWWIGSRLVAETLKSIDGYIDKDFIFQKILKKIGNKDVKILNWLSNAKSKDLAELVSILFNNKKKSKISHKIINEGVEEIEMILKYILKNKNIQKIYCTGGLSIFYKPYLKKNFSKYLVYDKVDPLLGALLISKKKFPIEQLINDNRAYF